MERMRVHVLLPNGKIRIINQYAEGESDAEFHGRLLCVIEDWILGVPKGAHRTGPVPKGTRWAEFDTRLGTQGLGHVYESTGEPYEHRRIRLHGVFDLKAANRKIREKT
jgi:hypothetical protein